MKLDRNVNPDGAGKYALLKLRNFRNLHGAKLALAQDAMTNLLELGVLEKGNVGSEGEFFPILLKDLFSFAALAAYASRAQEHDPEYAAEIYEMTKRAGPNSPFCKYPD